MFKVVRMLTVGSLMTLACPGAGLAQSAPLNVVASFSILGDMVHEIGGTDISLTTIVGPDGDAHSFEPTPKDARALSGAQVLVLNGLSFEGWLPRLVKASGFKGLEVVASKGIAPRRLSPAEQALEALEEAPADDHANHDRGERAHQHGNIDPHAWQSLINGVIYAQNIAAGLAKADPAHATEYHDRMKRYVAQMALLDDKMKAALAKIPAERRKVVTSHDAFGYFGQAYGIEFVAAAGLSNEAEPSAKEVAAIIDQVRKQHIPAVFVENITNPKLVKQIASETGARVGGTLYSDALAQPDQPAGTYLGMFEWNAGQLISALQPVSK